MTWSYVGKAGSYCDESGIQVSVLLSENNNISADKYNNVIADIVRENAVSRIVLDGNGLFSSDNIACVSEILSFAKSLRVPTTILINETCKNNNWDKVKSLFDIDTTDLMIELRANKLDACFARDVVDNALPKQNIAGYIHASTPDEADAVLSTMSDLGIKDVAMDMPQRQFVQKKALAYDIDLYQVRLSDAIISEKVGELSVDYIDAGEKTAA